MFKGRSKENEWVEVSTTSSNMKYYMNLSTFETSWKLPNDPQIKLVECYTEIKDPHTNKVYYSNLTTGASQWTKPNAHIVPRNKVNLPRRRAPRASYDPNFVPTEQVNEGEPKYQSATYSSTNYIAPSSYQQETISPHNRRSMFQSYRINNDVSQFGKSEYTLDSLRTPKNLMHGSYIRSEEVMGSSIPNRSTFENTIIIDGDDDETDNRLLNNVITPDDYNSEQEDSDENEDNNKGEIEQGRKLSISNESEKRPTNVTPNNNDDKKVKQTTLTRVQRFQYFTKNHLNYWELHYDKKNTPYYENRITKEKSYIRPSGVKIPSSKALFDRSIGSANSESKQEEESFLLVRLKECLGDTLSKRPIDRKNVLNTTSKFLFQNEEISKSNQQYIVKRKLNIFKTQTLYLIVNPSKGIITLHNKNTKKEEYSISTIKRIELYKPDTEIVMITFQVPEGYSISEAVNYKIPDPLILQFTGSKERLSFTNLIAYVKRYQSDLVVNKLQTDIDNTEYKNGVIKWLVAELTYKGSIPLFLFFYLPFSVVDSGKLKFETRQHIFYKEIPLENIKRVIKGKSAADEMSSIFLIQSDNTKMVILFNDKKARDSFVLMLQYYITH